MFCKSIVLKFTDRLWLEDFNNVLYTFSFSTSYFSKTTTVHTCAFSKTILTTYTVIHIFTVWILPHHKTSPFTSLMNMWLKLVIFKFTDRFVLENLNYINYTFSLSSSRISISSISSRIHHITKYWIKCIILWTPCSITTPCLIVWVNCYRSFMSMILYSIILKSTDRSNLNINFSEKYWLHVLYMIL